MSSTGMALIVVGVVIFLVGVVRHFAKLAFLGNFSHGSTILIVLGILVAIAGYLVGQSRRRSAV